MFIMQKPTKYICPNCGGTEFYVTALVEQEWQVDRYGRLIFVTNDRMRVVDEPQPNHIWMCTKCLTQAVEDTQETTIAGVDPEILKMPIVVLELSNRGYKCMKKSHILTLGDLVKLNYNELSTIKNLGSKTIEEIIEKMQKYIPGWEPEKIVNNP